MKMSRVCIVSALVLCTSVLVAYAAGPVDKPTTAAVESAGLTAKDIAVKKTAVPTVKTRPTELSAQQAAQPQLARAALGAVTRECGPGEVAITIEIMTDDYGSETSWEVTNADTGDVICEGPATAYESNTLYTEECCVDPAGCYNFTIFDSFGDGICCSYGEGYYNVYYDSTLVGSGGEFGTDESILFIGDGCGDPTGACCVDGVCVGTITEAECDAQGGEWYIGENCDTFVCPLPPPECPENTLFGQAVHLPDGDWAFSNSDLAAEYIIYESFSGVGGSICDVHFWGLSLLFDAGWFDCPGEDPFTIEVTFYADDAGAPGAVACGPYTVDVVGTPTGLLYAGFEMLEYDIILNPCCSLAEGWVSIQGVSLGDPDDCFFLWGSSPTGDGSSIQIDLSTGLPVEPAPVDRAVCLTGSFEPGACCDPFTGDCQDNVEFENCTYAEFYPGQTCLEINCGGDPGACCDDLTGDCVDDVLAANCAGRFAEGVLCNDLQPPCGTIVGACCYDDATCEVITEADCVANGGLWLGADTTCDMCPCIVPCPAGGIVEGEPCGDDVNGGCNMDVPTFEPIACGDTICGTTWADGGTRDTDWFELVLTEPAVLTITAEAEAEFVFGVIEQIVTGVPGCDNITGSISPYLVIGECEEGVITTECLPAGTYYLFAGLTVYEGLPCDVRYTLSVACDSPCDVPTGACCFQDGSCQDLTSVDCFNAGGNYQGNGTDCATTVCPIEGMDECADAELLSVPDSVVRSNNLATDDIVTPCGVSSGPWHNVWFAVEGTGNTMTATTCNPDLYEFDTKISVFCGACDYLICVGGNDDSCTGGASGLLSTVTWCSEAGVMYYITVGGYSSGTATGAFQLDVFDDGVACTGAIDCTLPTGACCVGAVCSVETPLDCADLGGDWLGEGTTCDPNPCTQGACCYNDTSCEELPQADCEANGGTYQGNGTLCANVECPCVLECPAGALLEGEPCGDDTNGGCNMETPTFEPIACGDVICGTTWAQGGTRDTDWYEITVTEPTRFTLTGVCEEALVIGMLEQIVPGVPGCDNLTGSLAPYLVTEGPCAEGVVVSGCLDAGTYYFFAGLTVYDGLPCDVNYILSLECEAPCVIMGACCFEDQSCEDLTEDACVAAGGMYMGDNTNCATTICPSEGDNCDDPFVIGPLSGADLPYTDTNYTCGRQDFYEDTCLGSYDGGEEMIYELILAEDMALDITLDPMGLNWSGIGIGDTCPIGAACIDYSTAGFSSEPHGIECLFLTAGTYYIHVDTWPSPDCLPEFVLTIERCIVPGACCVGSDCIPDIGEDECIALGGYFLGEGTNCGEFTYEASDCANAFEDISGTGTALTLGDDSGEFVPLGFTFSFYGVDYTEIAVCSNGYLTFSDEDLGDYTEDPIPNVELPNNIIAPLWDDFSPNNGGTVHYATMGTAPDRYFIAQWTDVPEYSNTGANTFQAILFEGSNCIEFRYGDFQTTDYVAGVENADGTVGLDVSTMVAVDGCIEICGMPGENPCICGDFTGPEDPAGSGQYPPDGVVDDLDYWFLLDAFASCAGDGSGRYQEICDLYDDDCINFVDYQEWILCYREANGRDFQRPSPNDDSGMLKESPQGPAPVQQKGVSKR